MRGKEHQAAVKAANAEKERQKFLRGRRPRNPFGAIKGYRVIPPPREPGPKDGTTCESEAAETPPGGPGPEA
jgi:hypothetical protein